MIFVFACILNQFIIIIIILLLLYPGCLSSGSLFRLELFCFPPVMQAVLTHLPL